MQRMGSTGQRPRAQHQLYSPPGRLWGIGDWGRPSMRVALRHRNESLAVDVKAERGGYRVAVDGQQHVVDVKQLDNATLVLSVDGCAYRVEIARNGHQRFVAVGGEVYA